MSPHEDDEKPQLGFELFQPGHSRQRNENEMTLNDDNFFQRWRYTKLQH